MLQAIEQKLPATKNTLGVILQGVTLKVLSLQNLFLKLNKNSILKLTFHQEARVHYININVTSYSRQY